MQLVGWRAAVARGAVRGAVGRVPGPVSGPVQDVANKVTKDKSLFVDKSTSNHRLV